MNNITDRSMLSEGFSRILSYFNHRQKKEIMKIGNEIRKGILKGEFTLYYQPQLDLETEQIIGAEVLVRWFHSEQGSISPGYFMPIAEKTDQIFPLEQWIVRKALQQKLKWESNGQGDLEISINLSIKTLENDKYFREILRILDDFSIDFSKVTFEITETAATQNSNVVLRNLLKIKEFGVNIAIDDFGTGFSSLSHLRNLSVDIIKIDISFISSLPENLSDRSIVKNTISMAHDLGCRVIAEGIEKIAQLRCLKELGCEQGQGYLFSKPMPEKDFHYLIAI